MEKNEFAKWFKISLYSLVVVAIYGTLMRYKIAFDFPYFDQKNLLHAHSHFAFSGWVSHVLYCGLVLIISPFISAAQLKKYKWLIGLNLLFAIGMLVTFTVQGYKLFSITFSTLSIVVAVGFAWCFIRDIKSVPKENRSRPWAVAGVILNVISSAGPFYLAYIMITKSVNMEMYLASVYYYLHFQYSGWFFFGTVAIVVHYLPAHAPDLRKYFRLFAIAVVPAYFLSTLWANLPMWLYVVTLIATLIQMYAWVVLLIKMWPFIKQMIQNTALHWVRIFFYASLFALSLKFVLQTISVIPSLSQLVFGFRPIVIAYLHLVLLGIYTLFFIGLFFTKGYINNSKAAKTAAFIFLTGVVLNELLLAIQGIGAFAYIPIPHINKMLFAVALLLLGGALGLALSRKREKVQE